jgi:hypothetical protein
MEPNTKSDLKSAPLQEGENPLGKFPDGQGQAEAQNRLTEDGPALTEGKKANPFLKFLNALWGPIRG